jgi:hypothetical protein
VATALVFQFRKRKLPIAFKILLSEYSSNGHKVQRITTDDEYALSAAKRPLAELGIDLTPTPADFHAKRAER